MKAIINHSEPSDKRGIENIQFVNHELIHEVKIVDYFEDPEKGQLIISLYSQLFSKNQIEISVRGGKVIIIVSESVGSFKSSMDFVSDWQSYGQRSYVRMRNISLLLPGDNFYLLRHVLVPEKLLLNIIIGRIIEN